MKNIHKTIVFTLIISLITAGFISIVQLNGQAKIESNASYFDPIIIDLLAFSISLFFIVEGVYRIREHKNDRYRKQFTRSLRIAFGVGIFVTHIIQATFKTTGINFPI